MRTKNDDIQSYVDQLTQEEEMRNAKLKKQLSELDSSKGASNVTQFIKDRVNYVIDNSRFEKSIPATSTFADVAKLLSQTNSSIPYFGYEDKSNQDVYLRNDRDIQFCFREFFGTSDKTLTLRHIKGDTLSSVLKGHFEEDCRDFENSFHCKLCIASKVDPCIFFSFKLGTTLDEALAILAKVRGSPVKKLSTIDSDLDQILITTDFEWEYFVAECKVLYKIGKFVTLYTE